VSPEVEPTIGDHVRIRETDDTALSGHAGKTGVCSGFSTPSTTRVGVLGVPTTNRAFNIGFEEGIDAWFAPGLIEVIADAADAENHR
jgi:hypothetical protein